MCALICWLMVLVGASHVARAQAIELGEGVPFAPAELAAALAARAEPGVAPATVAVHARGDDELVIEVGGRTRTLVLEGRRGPSAARLAAISAIDLMVPELIPVLETRVVTSSPPPPSESSRPPLAFTVFGSASSWSGVLATGGVDLAIPRAGWWLTGSFGGGTLVTGDLQLECATARIGVAVRPSVLELRIGAVLAPIVAPQGVGDWTVLVGGSASARVRIPIIAARHLVLAAGIDVFATRTDYVRAGMMTVGTPLFAPWAAAGYEIPL